jgi:type IV pilus assembly protein PilY1
MSTDPTDAQVTAGIDCENTTTYNCNGLSIPQGYSVKQNSVIDRVYAGDLKGNMWAFDLCAPETTTPTMCTTDPTKWGIAYTKSGAPAPLFTASHYSTGTPPVPTATPVQQKLCGTATKVACVQPITTRPMIVKNASINLTTGINTLVLFGTGQYLVENDPFSTVQQSVYGVWDHGLNSLTPANLVEQTFLTGSFYDNLGNDITNTTRVLTNNLVKYTTASSSKQGWFINLPAPKERLVVDPDVVQDKYFFFNTWIPGETIKETSGCASGGKALGSGYLMNVNLFTGSATSKPVIDVNLDGLVDNNDLVKNTVTSTSTTITSVVGGVIYEQGFPASSTFLNQKQYTAGAAYGSSAKNDALAAAKAAAAAAKAALDSAQKAYDAAVAAAAADPTNASKAANVITTKTAMDKAALASKQADSLVNALEVTDVKQADIANPVSRMVGGWRQILND